MARYGYIKLDKTDPDVARQASQLDTIGGFEKIYVQQHKDGRNVREIPFQLHLAIEALQPGDVLYVAALDRLCVSTEEFLRLVRLIQSKSAELVCLEASFDTRNSAGKLVVRMINKLSDLDKKTMSDKKKAGIIKAKEKGIRVGRPPVSLPVGFRQICTDWAENRITGTEAIRRSGMKSTTFYSKATDMGFQRKKDTTQYKK
jgi:DNA invertase Pin-like site-specific DNA recombinase